MSEDSDFKPKTTAKKTTAKKTASKPFTAAKTAESVQEPVLPTVDAVPGLKHTHKPGRRCRQCQ